MAWSRGLFTRKQSVVTVELRECISWLRAYARVNNVPRDMVIMFRSIYEQSQVSQ